MRTIKSMTDDPLIAKLRDKSSPKRRSAAKTLRKLRSHDACAPLLETLKRELLDDRTWQTQYQLIMALGECGCKSALPLIWELARSKVSATMRQVAVGDALVRLSDPAPLRLATIMTVLALAREYDVEVATGAMRAIAMLRLTFDEQTAEKLITEVDGLNNESVIFWTAAACSGWTGKAVRAFLERCLLSSTASTREVAEHALKGEYRTYNPL